MSEIVQSSDLDKNPVLAATSLAIQLAKKKGAEEVSADDLLAASLRVISRFGVVEASGIIIDLEQLGIDWLEKLPPSAKVSYSDGVVRVLDFAARIANGEGAGRVAIEHVLAAFANEDLGLMAELKRQHGFSSAGWRAFCAALGRRKISEEGSAAASGGYLSPEEAARELGIHVQTVRGYVRSGKLPALRLAGERAIRIRREDLKELLEPVEPEE